MSKVMSQDRHLSWKILCMYLSTFHICPPEIVLNKNSFSIDTSNMKFYSFRALSTSGEIRVDKKDHNIKTFCYPYLYPWLMRILLLVDDNVSLLNKTLLFNKYFISLFSKDILWTDTRRT